MKIYFADEQKSVAGTFFILPGAGSLDMMLSAINKKE
jgi:hypothetical protein